VPTIVLSPYARHHFIDHNQLEFDSILRFVEDDFHLPALTDWDRHAPSMLSSFDFRQKPLSPMVLRPRTCPKSAYATTTPLNGQVLKFKVVHRLHTVVLRIKGNTLVTVLFGPAFHLSDRQGRQLAFNLLSTRDQIVTKGTPDPQRALVCSAFSLRDISVTELRRARGIIAEVDQDGSSFTARLGKQNVLVNVSPGTSITLPNGARGSLNDLVGNEDFTISGPFNIRSKIVLRATAIQLLTAPSARLTARIQYPSVAPGGKQAISINAPPGTTLSITVRYPSGRTRRAPLSVSGSGRMIYRFTVPSNAATAHSTAAQVVISSNRGKVRTSFQVKQPGG
jgi:hypothetical protein